MHTSWNSIRSKKSIGNRHFMPTRANRTHLARIKDKHKEPLKTWGALSSMNIRFHRLIMSEMEVHG
ncbi:hypothetical protein PanWU01x14_103400 [Parasponia andersonii]|uniref:Uncharacterized protein n=1 Tax=Parasponia andersonii TaxID=3476 RepID=A0A2P5D223_PARAD|nr:hypothetical protein PanWU01x14_103400 [Parasponia andersonii]